MISGDGSRRVRRDLRAAARAASALARIERRKEHERAKERREALAPAPDITVGGDGAPPHPSGGGSSLPSKRAAASPRTPATPRRPFVPAPPRRSTTQATLPFQSSSEASVGGVPGPQAGASAHRREQVDGSSQNRPQTALEGPLGDELPDYGMVVLEDRGGRQREMPWWSPAQVGRAVHREAVQAVKEELDRGGFPRRRRLKSGRGEKARRTPELLTDDDYHAWRPTFSALAERALNHVYCVAQRPDEAPASSLMLVHHETCETDFVVPKSCNLRACPKCNARRFAKACDDIEKWLAGANLSSRDVRFLTLTMKNVDDLREGVERMTKAVKLLRRRPWFKNLTRGGVVAIQWTKYGRDWHVHAHLVLVGVYLPRQMLVDAWAEIMSEGELGEGSGVDIRAWKGDSIAAFKEALGYVYPTKSRLYPQLEDFATVEIQLRGKRLVQPFGKLHGIRNPREPRCCPRCSVTDAHWKTKGHPNEVDHAVFVHLHRSTDGPADRMVEIATGKKWALVSPRVALADRRWMRALARSEWDK